MYRGKEVNRFDYKYEIRLAQIDEIPEIMNFINCYWKNGHILGVNRDFFEYEMVVDGQVNFLIAKRKEDGRIDGILGFLPCSNVTDKLDTWGVIWKTIDGAAPMLGIELKKRLFAVTGMRNDLGVGANLETSVPLLKRVGHYYTAKMHHYYCLSEREHYIIAEVKNYKPHIYNKANRTKFKILDGFNELISFYDFDSDRILPYKNAWYYNRRFYHHPIYQYTVWGLENHNSSKRAIMVTREQEYNAAKIMRIVDYRGEQSLFAGCGYFLEKALLNYEYVDFYFDGFDVSYVENAGMTRLLENDSNVIPDHFHPFEQCNIDIWVDCSDCRNKYLFFKADGDQDRPNEGVHFKAGRNKDAEYVDKSIFV